MAVVSILSVLAFAVITSMIEVPKMIAGKLYRELWVYSALLATGVALAILKSLNIFIPNPSDWIAWFYSPVSNLLQGLLE